MRVVGLLVHGQAGLELLDLGQGLLQPLLEGVEVLFDDVDLPFGSLTLLLEHGPMASDWSDPSGWDSSATATGPPGVSHTGTYVRSFPPRTSLWTSPPATRNVRSRRYEGRVPITFDCSA